MRFARQATLRDEAELSGFGVHSGIPVDLTIRPAEADAGILFVRAVPGEPRREIRAEARSVAATEFATVLGDNTGPAVATVEHMMAALYGLGIDNAVVELNGPELPAMDGSAAPFVDAIDAVGIVTLDAPRRYLRVLRPIGVTCGESYGELRPYEGLRLDIEIQFDHALIGRQFFSCEIDPRNFRTQLARARTFGFARDVARLWSAGYALGASLDNTVVVGDDAVVNAEGLRFADEFVRHKALDGLGDLALAGMPILGAFKSIRGGHRLNYAVLSALMADKTAWTVVEEHPPMRPARRFVGSDGGLRPTLAPGFS